MRAALQGGTCHNFAGKILVIGIRPTVDFAFKVVFGSRRHAAVTIHFLNAVLGLGPRITKVEFLDPKLGQESAADKLSILDIRATDEHGRSLNIEMQTTLPAGMSQRLAYYASRLYVSQMTEVTRYADLRPAVSICVLTKSMFPAIPELHLDFRLREVSGKLLTDDVQIHLVELPKLRVTAENVREATPIEQWAFFLQNAHVLTLEEIQQLFPDPEFSEAAGVLEMISLTPAQHQLYEDRLKAQKDAEARLEGARLEGNLQSRVQLLQELLGITAPSADELSSYSAPQLSILEEELKSQLRDRLR